MERHLAFEVYKILETGNKLPTMKIYGKNPVLQR